MDCILQGFIVKRSLRGETDHPSGSAFLKMFTDNRNVYQATYLRERVLSSIPKACVYVLCREKSVRLYFYRFQEDLRMPWLERLASAFKEDINDFIVVCAAQQIIRICRLFPTENPPVSSFPCYFNHDDLTVFRSSVSFIKDSF